MIAALICLIIGSDQLVKYLIRSNFKEGETLPVIQDVFHITYVRNWGAAFSMFQNQPLVTILIPVVFMVLCAVFLVYGKKKGFDRMEMTAVAMIFAGGTSNLIDRTVVGYVTDMFDFRVFPVFNVADIAVTLGCALLFVYVLFFEGKRGKNDE
ncbi:signal peptidase II [Mobilibacterium timonense]|uniref:signal peptidase II n=1 Tax=Mobilibacterium timonense TaxID=1871012 RepID=UPI0023569EA9|nr:signal peptidase II [Mobilibacterium timonense]MBM6991352.1 signal peptidase II [Mobilibacterium timonense]